MNDHTNILLIMTDQQSAGAMSCRLGGVHLNTPAADRLAAEGTLFTRAYTVSPVCRPARNAMFTGHYPHETGIECNRSHPLRDSGPSPDLPEPCVCLGRRFADAGYDTAYFGKWHLNLDVQDARRHGFMTTGVLKPKGSDPAIADAACAYLHRPRVKPFLAVVSLSNPHDICQHADGLPLPSGPIPGAPEEDALPPLPLNMAPTRDAPDILRHMREAYYAVHCRRSVGTQEERREAREHVWAYYRLIERADALVGHVLDALDVSGRAANTVVLLTSDHGELQGAHGLVQKSFFYEEAMRVPLIVRDGSMARRQVDKALVNTGIDLLPTLLDYAEIPIPGSLPGRSLRSWVQGRSEATWRDYLIGQVHLCHPKMPPVIPRPYSRMVRSDRYKYWTFEAGRPAEILFDLEDDPGETANIALDPSCHGILEQHRDYLREHAERHGDDKAREILLGLAATTQTRERQRGDKRGHRT